MSSTDVRRAVVAPRLLSHLVCPHCWERYPVDEVVWVAEHSELRGDERLGPEASQRFLPSRFTPEGNAIDPRGRACHQLACARCHLTLPRSVTELEPLFISVLGTPGSGKSYFMTTAIWKLREILPSHFAVGFADADPTLNQSLIEAEETLFLNPDPDKLIWLGSLIAKTDAESINQKLYNGVTYGSHTVTYLQPYLFALDLKQAKLKRYFPIRAANRAAGRRSVRPTRGGRFDVLWKVLHTL
jgi:hypothetical protein